MSNEEKLKDTSSVSKGKSGSIISFEFIEEGQEDKASQAAKWRKYTVSMPASYVIDKTNSIIDNKAKDFELKNLSSSPESSIAKRAAESARNKARKEIGSKTISEQLDYAIAMMVQKIIVDEKLIISSPPAIDVKDFDRDADIVCSVKFFLCPDMKPIDYSKVDVQLLDLEVSDDDIARAKEFMGQDFNWEDAPDSDYKAQNGDQVVIDFEGKIDGEVFDGGVGTNAQLVIGEGRFLPDLENGIVGLAANEEKTIQVKFPEDYHAESFRGKTADFKVRVKQIMVKDESQGEVSEELLVENLKSDFDVIARLWTKKKLFDSLHQLVEMAIPPKMIEVDFKSLWNETISKVKKNNVSKDELAKELMKIAERRVKLGLILAHIARNDDIEVGDGDVKLAIEMESQRRPGQEEEVKAFYQDRENYEKLKGAVLEEKVVDFLLNNINPKSIKITAEEFNEKYAPELQDIPEFLKGIED